MDEPIQNLRKQLGVIVLIALAILLVFTCALKREYWRDIH
jgi:cytochrome c1